MNAHPINDAKTRSILSKPRVPAASDEDDALTLAMEEYRMAVDQGQAVDHATFLAKYPQLAGELSECLASLDFIHQVAPQLLDEPKPAGSEIRPLACLGDYRIVRELGRGGMGVVYEAEQLSLGRRVALKVLPFAAMLDERQLTRFRNEARTAAILKHPNIVSVHAVGCERGVHYYTMELVDGQSLAEVIQAVRKTESDDRTPPGDLVHTARRADTSTVAVYSTQRSSDRRGYFHCAAKLAIDVAQALHYGHQQGVIHRDIKPSNLLIDREGKPWITDFGLAYVQRDQTLTMTGDLLGTLRYMSPEQASGNRGVVDHRTDIYSLGVTLYEILTLRPAFDGEDRQMLLRQIEELDPPSLRSIDSEIPRDLQNIVNKAIAKRRDDRYESALELAEDLQRFVNNRPVTAVPPSRLNHAWRWVCRNPLLAVLLTTLLTLVLGLAIGGPWLAIREVAVRREADSARQLADTNRRELQELLNSMLSDTAVLAAARPDAYPLQRKILTSVVEYYDPLIERSGDDPSVRLEAAVAFGQAGRTYKIMTEPEEARRLLSRAVDILSELVQQHPTELRYRYELAQVLLWSANLRNVMHDQQGAVAERRRASILAAEAAAGDPENATYARRSAWCDSFLGKIEMECGAVLDAERAERNAVAKFQRLAAREDAILEDSWGLAFSQLVLMRWCISVHRFQEAEENLVSTKELIDHVILPKSERIETPAMIGEGFAGIGRLDLMTRCPTRYEDRIRSCIINLENLLQGYPDYDWAHQSLGELYLSLSDILLATDRLSEAESAARSAIASWKGREDHSPQWVEQSLWAEFRLAQLLWSINRDEEARTCFTQMVDRCEMMHRKSPEFRDYAQWLAIALVTCPDSQPADYQRAAQLAQESHHPQEGRSWQLLGIARFRCRDWEAAKTALTKATELRNGGDAVDYFYLAMTNHQLGHQAEAQQWYRQALDHYDDPIQLYAITHPMQLKDLREEADAVLREGETGD